MAADEELRNHSPSLQRSVVRSPHVKKNDLTLEAFREQLNKVTEAKQQIARMEEVKLTALKNEKASLRAVKKLEDMSGSPIYRGVGRLFLLTTQQDEIERHKKEAHNYSTTAAAMDKKKEFLQKSCEAGERNLRDLVESKR